MKWQSRVVEPLPREVCESRADKPVSALAALMVGRGAEGMSAAPATLSWPPQKIGNAFRRYLI